MPSRPDDDEDPTGIRALLASLPDPGPMPDDVARRIADSIAAEQARLGSGAAPGPVVTPLVRRRPTWQKVGLAAAAVVAVGVVGSAMSGTSPSEVAAFISHGSSSDSAASTAESAADAGGLESGGDAGADSPLAEPSSGTDDSAPNGLSVDLTTASGTAYVSADLATQAAGTRSAWMRGTRSMASADQGASPLVARVGLEDCLKGLGLSDVTLVGADLGTFDGAPAAIVVVRSAGSADVAYAVSPACSSADPGQLAGPVSLP